MNSSAELAALIEQLRMVAATGRSIEFRSRHAELLIAALDRKALEDILNRIVEVKQRRYPTTFAKAAIKVQRARVLEHVAEWLVDNDSESFYVAAKNLLEELERRE